MDTAVNIEGNINVSDDGSWSYSWAWTYSGDGSLSDAHEEFLITDQSGLIIDSVREASHSVDPGQTYLGGGSGNRQLPSGDLRWKLHVIQGGGFLGVTGANFFSASSR